MGGPGTPPGKPGYKLVQLVGNRTTDEMAINAAHDLGYEIQTIQPKALSDMHYLLLNNYKGKDE